MSERSNLVLVDEHGYSVYHSHATLALDTYMFWGPEYAIKFVEKHTPYEYWYDTIDAEGGVLIDTTQNIVMLYGCETTELTLPLRHLYLQLMRHLWKGWQIKWADNGLFDLVDYVGYPRKKVTHKNSSDLITYPNGPLQSFEFDDDLPVIASIRLADGTIKVCVQMCFIEELFEHGQALIDELSILGETSIQTIDETKRFPFQGAHIDIAEHSVSYWSARPRPMFAQETNFFWHDWTLNWLKSDYEAHIALSENRIKIYHPSTEFLLAELERLLVAEKPNPPDWNDPNYDSVYEFRRKYPPEIPVRKQLFTQAVEAWRASQNIT